MLRISRLWFVVLLLATTAVAQVRTGGFGGFRSTAFARSFHRPYAGYYGFPAWYSDYYEPYNYEFVPEPPPIPAPAIQVKTEPVPDPELLELRDGQWVKVTSFSQPSNGALTTGAVTATTPTPLPPAVLVFRDGHTEEISSYSIIGKAIYTKADYWSTCKWTRSIAVADLNIPATLKRNQERGLNFELPSSPDEVMIRP